MSNLESLTIEDVVLNGNQNELNDYLEIELSLNREIVNTILTNNAIYFPIEIEIISINLTVINDLWSNKIYK